MSNFSYKNLQRQGKCICCGKDISTKEKVIRLDTVYKSQVYGTTICKKCVEDFNKLIKEK